ncbi:AAA family ATPase [Hamadaea tsunoensis]|uniref:AAA family ATPase n=1 Tax=Hamadaea tsunoensis TaxID=53368 RepID=UPI0003F7019F|nr:MoxR family ATPase [Hamadaea tsunoensis]
MADDIRQPPAWWIYRGTGVPHDGIDGLIDPPSWRTFGREAPAVAPLVAAPAKDEEIGRRYRPDTDVVERVNAALLLRRPMLVTGAPGTGKSTLAFAIAYELGLGKVLRWNISSRSTKQDGLYQYDPLARLHDAQQGGGGGSEDVGHYIRLGPLGTALLPRIRPHVLLIDEIDKSDLDLPNDLLNVLEDGTFDIPELLRQPGEDGGAEVMIAESAQRVRVAGGVVQCRDFPIVVMTSNDEREFPPAFKRRCIQIAIQQPDVDKLRAIVDAHLVGLADQSGELIREFLAARSSHELATDQLLNAIFLTGNVGLDEQSRLELAQRLYNLKSAYGG